VQTGIGVAVGGAGVSVAVAVGGTAVGDAVTIGASAVLMMVGETAVSGAISLTLQAANKRLNTTASITTHNRIIDLLGRSYTETEVQKNPSILTRIAAPSQIQSKNGYTDDTD
jgi:hypothetical protein